MPEAIEIRIIMLIFLVVGVVLTYRIYRQTE